MKSTRIRPTRSRASNNGRLPKSRRHLRTMPLGQFLFQYLHDNGVRHSFGVPGDFALPTFAWLDKSPIQSITMTHEPGAGFAADAYSRINGIGLVTVTYCVGGLNVLNAVAGAFAEKSPIVVVSGGPGRKDREKDPLVHHKVRTFETQRRIYDELTAASTILLDEQHAAEEIIRCVDACVQQKRPVYIEVPYDIVDRPIPIPPQPAANHRQQTTDPQTLRAALDETVAMLRAARKPVILAGVELHRYRLARYAIGLAEKLNIPIAADLLSKSAVRENHPLYLGVYGGAMSSDPAVRAYVESADCVLMLGTFITDMSMGIYTARLDRTRTILATTESIKIAFHHYDNITFPDYLDALLHCCNKQHTTSNKRLTKKKFTHPSPHSTPAPLAKNELTDPLTMKEVIRILGLHLDENCCLVCDVGDGLFGALGIRTARQAEFIAPAYYLSMGFAVPASIGVEVASPALRPIVLVGDGAFQMTGTELSTAVRLGLKPIVLILNNEGYGTMRKIRDGRYNLISQWNYGKICELIGGGESTIAATKGELDGALTSALGSGALRVIDVRIPRNDMSPQLANMSAELAKLRAPERAAAR